MAALGRRGMLPHKAVGGVLMTGLPPLRPVRSAYRQPRVADVETAARDAVLGSGLRLAPGARTAVLVGSRGIASLPSLVAGVVGALRRLGAQPFLVPAMGTHGGGTAEGQKAALLRLGVTEALAPIVSERRVVALGTSARGDPVWCAAAAAEAEAIVAVNRIKSHTSFTGPWESGLAKMLAVGLGQSAGARVAHARGPGALAALIPASAQTAIERTPFRLGVAVVENAAREIGMVQALLPETLLADELLLLVQAKAWAPQLPFSAADVLVVGELGKNFSGVGMDPAVIGRRMVEAEPDHPSPRIVRIAALGLAPESGGNALGVGLADLATQRLLDAIDFPSLRANALAAQLLQRARLPLALPDDRATIAAAFDTCWQPDPARVRLAVIPNTLELSNIYATEALAAELVPPAGAELELGPPVAWRWQADGVTLDLAAMFPEALPGRRRGTA